MKYNDLLEALSIDTAKKYRKLWNKDNNKNLFLNINNKNNWNLSKNTFRLYKKLPNSGIINKSNTQAYIENILNINNYQIIDYIKGIAKDNQNRNVKISKVLNRYQPDLLQSFNNDPIRQATKQQNQYIVISRHPYDVAGMSTDRGWRSCMSLVDGENKHYIDADIKLGTLIAYQITGTDLNINNPMGRILIKPLVSLDNPNDYVLVKSNASYGTVTDSFRKELSDFIAISNDILGVGNTLYCLSDDLYNEVESSTKGVLTLDHVKKNKLFDKLLKYIRNNIKIDDDLQDYIMKDPEYAYNYAKYVLEDRWPEAEPYIMKDPVWAYYYARDTIKDRWYEAEPYIKGSIYQEYYEDDFGVVL